MSDHRAFRGVWIPADIWMNRELSLQEKVMLIEIDSLQHPERGCFKTNKALAEFFDLSPSRVSRIIARLEQAGWVRVELMKEGKQIVERRIFMTRPLGSAETQEGYCGNASNPSAEAQEGYCGNASERGSGVRGSTPRGSDKPSRPSDDVRAVFDHWREVMGKSDRTVLDDNRKRLITKALDSYSLDDVMAAITGCSLSPYHMGENPGRKRYNELGLILRNADKIEQFIGYAEQPPANVHRLEDHRPRPKHTGLDQANAAGLTPRADGTFSL